PVEAESEKTAGQNTFAVLNDDARGNAIPFLQGPRGGSFADQNGLAAADQVPRQEGLPGNDRARLVEAHGRVPQAPHVALRQSRFVPAAALEIVVDEGAAFELPAEKVLERHAP